MLSVRRRVRTPHLRRRGFVAVLVAAVAVSTWWVAAGPAPTPEREPPAQRETSGASQVGSLTFAACAANDATLGCVDLPPAGAGGPLDGASGVAVSPDGGSAYIASYEADAIVHFVRDAGGTVTFAGCLNNGGTLGCVDLSPAGAGGPLDGALAVAVSRDGTAVYVSAENGDSLTHFYRLAGGQLAFGGCVANNPAVGGCTDLPPAGVGGPLDGADGISVSPDGSSVYVASRNSSSLAHFVRAPTGQLTFGGCVANDPTLAGCTDLPPAGTSGPLVGAGSVAVSPNGASVYVVSFFSSSLTRFSRAAGGQVTFSECLNLNGGLGCADVPPAGAEGPIDRPGAVAVSPDGGSVYVVASVGDSVTRFSQAANGQLAFAGCLSNAGTLGCVDLAPQGADGPLDFAIDLALSPDGASLYVSSNTSNSLAHFARASGGELTFAGCLANDAGVGCADLPPQGAAGPLGDAFGVAVSPDGGSVYVASYVSDSLTQFVRALTASPPPPAPPPAEPEPVAKPVSCRGRLATIVGTARADKLEGTPGNDVVAALGGADAVDARGGDDIICGGSGGDTLRGGAGADEVYGGAGADAVGGGPGDDRLFGGPGRDQFRGGVGEDLCVGGPAVDRSLGCETTRSI